MRTTTLTTTLALAAILALSLATANAFAATGTAQQRALFKSAWNDARNGALAANDARLAQLRDYPLYPYLQAARLRHRLAVAPGGSLDKRIAGFIDGHPVLPPAQRLRDPWLESLGRRGRWQLVLAYTRADDDTADQCRAVHARIALGQNPRQEALALWRVGDSQPGTCDPVFAWLEAQGLMTPAEIMRRARLALLAGQYGLVKYLADKLPAGMAAQTQQWIDAAQSTAVLRSARSLPDDVLAYAFKRYALRDWQGAADLYPRLVDRLQPDAQARYEMANYIALLHAQDQLPTALVWFARLDNTLRDDHSRAWEVRAAIWQRRWPLVIDAVRAMPADQAKEEEWRYWLGRAHLELGHLQKANTILGELATHRSYYGYLAADLLGQPYSFNERPLPPHPQVRTKVLALPALARASELHKLGWNWRFRLEWNAVTDGLNPIELREAARIAHQRGWHSRAIITLARSDYWDALDIRYPTPYLASIKSEARAKGLDPAYVLAIMRTESLFMPNVRSSAGAIGLMQLMPGTARLIANRNGLATPSTSSLRNPAINIRFGTRYLSSMKQRFGGNLALATAAYNAGPGAVARWLPAVGSVPPEIWVANISYTETREYVERVMSHMTVFQHRLHENIVPIKARLAPIQTELTYAAGGG